MGVIEADELISMFTDLHQYKVQLTHTSLHHFPVRRFEKISSCLVEVREKNPTIFDSIVPQLIQHLQVNVKVGCTELQNIYILLSN